jgi:hypothetical protein
MPKSEDPPNNVYVIPSTSFHFGRPEESYLVYDNHRKMLSELFNNCKKYYCAEDIKQDLMSVEAPIAPCSTYDETARVAFAMVNQCHTLEEFQAFFEGWLNYPNAVMPGSLIVPTLVKSEVGRSLLKPATELARGCYAACGIAIAVVACSLATCPLGASVRDLNPKSFKIPDYARKDLFSADTHIRDGVKATKLAIKG